MTNITNKKLGAEQYDSVQIALVKTNLKQMLTELFDDIEWCDIQYALGFFRLGLGDYFMDRLRQYLHLRDVNHQSFEDFIMAVDCPVALNEGGQG
jgi:glutaredoxin-related protein